jgi:hypothetical protein
MAGHACLAELAPSTVHELLNNQPIKPYKVRYYLDRRDPAFAERKAEVIEVYGAVEMLRSLPEAELPSLSSPTTRSPAFKRLPPPPQIRTSIPPSNATKNISGSAP